MTNNVEIPLKVRDASRQLVFHITKKHVKIAKCGDPKECVIAQAVRDALPDHVRELHVGAKITKIVDIAGHVIRYRTPVVLATALRRFDLKKGWLLPDGEYRLTPPSPSHRLGSRRGQRTGPKVGTPKGKRHTVPTRHVRSIYQVAPPADKPPSATPSARKTKSTPKKKPS